LPPKQLGLQAHITPPCLPLPSFPPPPLLFLLLLLLLVLEFEFRALHLLYHWAMPPNLSAWVIFQIGSCAFCPGWPRTTILLPRPSCAWLSDLFFAFLFFFLSCFSSLFLYES
jgi:hypothetical protein